MHHSNHATNRHSKDATTIEPPTIDDDDNQSRMNMSVASQHTTRTAATNRSRRSSNRSIRSARTAPIIVAGKSSKYRKGTNGERVVNTAKKSDDVTL